MRSVVFTLFLAVGTLTTEVQSAPRPTQANTVYSLDILGFNEGEPYRIQGAEAEAVLTDKGAVIFRFHSADWTGKKSSGGYVAVAEVTKRFARRSASDLVDVFRLDLDRDGQSEYLLVPNKKRIGNKKRYAPTVIKRSTDGFTPMWSCKELPGDQFKVLDIRDLNGDGIPEFLLNGQAGGRGYYQFHRLIGLSSAGFTALGIKHVDSVHFVDLTADGRIEIVVRTRVGRRGPASQWTYVDQLYRWTGTAFEDASRQHPRYHDEETLPALVDDLINHFDAKLAVRLEKVEAIERVRSSTLESVARPRGYRKKVIRALKALQGKKMKQAKRLLESLQQQYRYDTRVLMGLTRVYGHESRWELALESSLRAITVAPRLREAWWQAAIAFVHLSERSSARASLHNAVQLCGKTDEGLAFLRARRNEQELPAVLNKAIEGTLKQLGPSPR